MKRFAIILLFLPSVALAALEDIPPLRPPRGEMPPTFWEQWHREILVNAAALVLALTGLGLVWMKRTRVRHVIPAAVIARRDLEKWRGRSDFARLTGDVSRTVRHYVVNVFGLPPEELTTSEIAQILHSHELSDDVIASTVTGFLRRCDAQKFGPAPVPDKVEVVTAALEVVAVVEQRRKTDPSTIPETAASAAANPNR